MLLGLAHETALLDETALLLVVARGHADVLETVDGFLELVAEFLHFLHLIRIEPIIPPIAPGISLPPMPIQITGIELIIGPVIILLNNDLL